MIGLIFLAHLLHAQEAINWYGGCPVGDCGLTPWIRPTPRVRWSAEVECIEQSNGDIYCRCRGEKEKP